MTEKQRIQMMAAGLASLIVALALLLSPVALRPLYAQGGCSCSANCLFNDCECSGDFGCACTCVLFGGNCACDELLE
jgi:hypothetical protein